MLCHLFPLKRYVDENVEDDSKPPVVSGFAVQIRDGATKSGRLGHRSSMGSMQGEEEGSYMAVDGDSGGDMMMQSSIAEVDEEDVGPLIPPPPSFRGATRGGAKNLAQSVPQVRIQELCIF